MVKNFECKLGKRPHLIKNPVELPCQALACWQCILEQKDHFSNFICKSCGQLHRFDEEIMLKHTLLLQRSLILNTKEIANEMIAKLNKSLFNFNDYLSYRKQAIGNMFEFLQQVIEVRVESIYIELENVKEQFEQSMESIKSDVRDEVKFMREKRMYLNTLKYTNPKPKMAVVLKDLRKFSKTLEKSGQALTSMTKQLSEFKSSTKPLRHDKTGLIGKLTSLVKPFDFVDVANSRVQYVDMFGYTTNLTSLCPIGDGDGLLILDNYLNAVSLFDKNFNLVKSVCLNDLANVRRERLTFNSNLYGIVASSRFLYINNMDQNQIVVLDFQLESIKAIIQPLKVKSMFEIDAYADMLFVLDNKNREVLRFDATGDLMDSVKLEDTSLEKYAQNENFSKIENSTRFANISNSFTISKWSEMIACFRPFLGEINLHKFDGSLLQVIENVFEPKISVCFAPTHYFLVYSGGEGSIVFFDQSQQDRTKEQHFEPIGKVKKPRLVCQQHYHYLSCHRKIVFFNNRLFVLFSENNSIGIVEC